MAQLTRLATCITAVLLGALTLADRLELVDGTVIEPCFVRHEGVRLLVWDSMDQVGGPASKTFLKSQVKDFKLKRDESWDAKPARPDLSVTFIEMTPKLAGLHGRVQYAAPWIMKPGGCPEIEDTGDRGYLYPESTVRNVKFQYQPGEEVTLTAHVKNLGFVKSQSFDYVWLIDGVEVKKGTFSKPLLEMQEATFVYKYKWLSGKHTATFKIITKQPEIATINNELEDPLWGFSYVFIVSKGRVNMWHQFRSAYGTFSFEDYYRWHIEIMNTLFKASVFPSAPNGIEARVRLDRIVYADDVQKAKAERDNGHLIMDQGAWIWEDSPEEIKTGKFGQTNWEWRCATEWSLPHELGHQLGLIDWYAHDCDGSDSFKWSDSGQRVVHFQNHPEAMMHWHGPQTFNEVDAGYLNLTWNKPRGHFGDHVFAIPAENYLRVVDVNGQPVPFAKVEVFQRGVKVDPNGKPEIQKAITFYPIVMDGEYDNEIRKDPVISGNTDESGMIRLPNRPVRPVKTLNGFELKPNPFGHLTCFAPSLMMVKVTKFDKPQYFWLEIYDFNVAWLRGQKDRFDQTLRTPYRSASSPLSPTNVTVTKIDEDHVKVSWKAPAVSLEQQSYLNRPIGYKIYRRVGDMGLNDRPWFVVGTVGKDTTEFVVNIKDYPVDTEWFTKTQRFAVSSVGDQSVESELVDVVMK